MSSLSTFASTEHEQYILDRLPQVRLIATRFHRRCPPCVLLEDLISAGVIGLIEAAHRYDSRRNLKFKTLAEHRIRGAMLDYLRSLDPLPRGVRRFVRERGAVMASLKNGVSDLEVAAAMGIPIDRYRSLARIAGSADVARLDGHNVIDYSRAPADGALLRELNDAVRSLPVLERTVIESLRIGQTPREIAQNLCMTSRQVTDAYQRAVTKLRIAFGFGTANQKVRSPGLAQALDHAS